MASNYHQGEQSYDTYSLTSIGNSFNCHHGQHPPSIEQRSSEAGSSYTLYATNSTLSISQNQSHPPSSCTFTTTAQPASIVQPVIQSNQHITLTSAHQAHVEPTHATLAFSKSIDFDQRLAAETVVFTRKSALIHDISDTGLKTHAHIAATFLISYKHSMDPISSLPICEDRPAIPPTTSDRQKYIAVWKGRDNTLLHGGMNDTLVHGNLDEQVRCEAKKILSSELPSYEPKCEQPSSALNNFLPNNEKLFEISPICTNGNQELEWKATNGITQLESSGVLSEEEYIHVGPCIRDLLKSLEDLAEASCQPNIPLPAKSALDYINEYKKLKICSNHGNINQKSDEPVYTPYARRSSYCDVVPSWQLDFDALNNLILPLRHRIPSAIPYYERIVQCHKKMEDKGNGLRQGYNRALDALLQSSETRKDLYNALAQPASSQHEIACLQTNYSESQTIYQDWKRRALQFVTVMSDENGRALVKLTDDFVNSVLPLVISVANEELDDQSVEFSITARDQAFRNRKKQQEKALKHAPREPKRQKLVSLNHSSSGHRYGNSYEYKDAVIDPDRNKCRSQSDIITPVQTTCNTLFLLDEVKQVNRPVGETQALKSNPSLSTTHRGNLTSTLQSPKPTLRQQSQNYNITSNRNQTRRPSMAPQLSPGRLDAPQKGRVSSNTSQGSKQSHHPTFTTPADYSLNTSTVSTPTFLGNLGHSYTLPSKFSHISPSKSRTLNQPVTSIPATSTLRRASIQSSSRFSSRNQQQRIAVSQRILPPQQQGTHHLDSSMFFHVATQQPPESPSQHMRLCQKQERVPIGRIVAPQVLNMRPSGLLVPQGLEIRQTRLVGPLPSTANGFALSNAPGNRIPGWNKQQGWPSNFPQKQPGYKEILHDHFMAMYQSKALPTQESCQNTQYGILRGTPYMPAELRAQVHLEHSQHSPNNTQQQSPDMVRQDSGYSSAVVQPSTPLDPRFFPSFRCDSLIEPTRSPTPGAIRSAQALPINFSGENGHFVPLNGTNGFSGWNGRQFTSLTDQGGFSTLKTKWLQGLNTPESLRLSSLGAHIQYPGIQSHFTFAKNIASDTSSSLKRTLDSVTPDDTEGRQTKHPCLG